ncbi:PRC-barrel domain-containing protein [Ammoniphilus sp. CFH 90114]|uniref:PRC-barrel domain-containing protein n=1 Tax=Ammoniphilus sp. CFH 90114 TaxID=2493665 RepID=UPI0013E99A4F|nr:PRC-barrel domain-containing protein [Ammoniphilus sp. CFH 90114]
MYKANDVIGLPVLDLQAGQELGVVRDVLFDEDWTFQGLLIEIKAMFRRGRFIPTDSIHAIGDDYVTISHVGAMLPLEGTEQFNGVKAGPIRMIGKPVITSNGHRLGEVEDVYFQTEIGSIIGYELSDGLLTDLLEGRKAIKHLERTRVGEDAVVLPVTGLTDQEGIHLTEREETTNEK